MPQYSEESYDANRELLKLMRNLAAEKNASPAQIALAWMINKKPYIVSIPGSRKSRRIHENLEAGNIILSENEVADIDSQLESIHISDVFGGSPVKK